MLSQHRRFFGLSGPLCQALLPLAGVAALASITALPGCGAAERSMLNDVQLQEKAVADAAHSRSTFDDAITRLLARTWNEYQKTGEKEAPTINFLALSGGGDYGAFGAGVLVGWGTIPDVAARRPDFDAVTGVSTGAQIGPFAYIGTDAACAQVENFYRNPKPDWVLDRGLLFFMPSNPSFMTLPGLERDIRDAINKDFVAQMAEQSKKGKILAISATNLDLGRQKFWSMGAEAEAATAKGDPHRVQQIMLASAAIPAAFPAVDIDGSLYADGGVTANVFLRLDAKSPHAFIPRWMKEHPGTPLPKFRYWVIINNQLAQAPNTVQPTWPSVLGPSLATAIRSATIAEVRWLAAEADYVNAVFKTDIEVRVMAIPDDWKAPVKGDFQKENMESLSDLGRKLGADPNAWQIWAAPSDRNLDPATHPRMR